MQSKNNGTTTILAALVAVLLVLVLNDAMGDGHGYGSSEGAPEIVSVSQSALFTFRFWSNGTVDVTVNEGPLVCDQEDLCTIQVLAGVEGKTLVAGDDWSGNIVRVWSDGTMDWARFVLPSLENCGDGFVCSSEPTPPSTMGDTNWDGSVDVVDLTNVITNWD